MNYFLNVLYLVSCKSWCRDDDVVSDAETCSSGVHIKDVLVGVVNEQFNTIS